MQSSDRYPTRVDNAVSAFLEEMKSAATGASCTLHDVLVTQISASVFKEMAAIKEFLAGTMRISYHFKKDSAETAQTLLPHLRSHLNTAISANPTENLLQLSCSALSSFFPPSAFFLSGSASLRRSTRFHGHIASSVVTFSFHGYYKAQALSHMMVASPTVRATGPCARKWRTTSVAKNWLRRARMLQRPNTRCRRSLLCSQTSFSSNLCATSWIPFLFQIWSPVSGR